MTVALKGIC